MFRSKKAITIILLTLYTLTHGQNNVIGQWQSHLPFTKIISLDYGLNKIFAASPYGVMYIDLSDYSKGGITKVNGLSDVGITKIRYSQDYQVLLVAYSNANIDIVDKNFKVTNISDIKRKSMVGRKDINDILFIGHYAYLACSFGIVVIDLTKNEIKDTYFIGPDGGYTTVWGLATNGTSIFAATKTGVYEAKIQNTNLSDFNNWKRHEGIPGYNNEFRLITYVYNRVYACKYSSQPNKDTLYYYDGATWKKFDFPYDVTYKSIRKTSNNKLLMVQNGLTCIIEENHSLGFNIYSYPIPNVTPDMMDAIYEEKNNLFWIGDSRLGLIEINWDIFYMVGLNGTGGPGCFAMDTRPNKIAVVPGGMTANWGNIWQPGAIYYRYYQDWMNFNRIDYPGLDTMPDMVSVAIDPSDDDHLFIGTWGKGVIEVNDFQIKGGYNDKNSTLRVPPDNGSYYWIGCAGLTFDNNNNLWVTNTRVPTPINVRKPDGTWVAYSLVGKINNPHVFNYGKIVVDDFGQKWVIIKDVGVLVYNDNNTIDNPSDDRVKVFMPLASAGSESNNGQGLPSSTVNCIAKDKSGRIWVGTNKGIAVFYNPENAFTDNNYNAEQILIEQDGHGQYVLEAEVVTAIAVDGANRKWIGTQTGGVFLFSEDCTEMKEHFTIDNSPLPSDQILSLAIDPETGEVYFGTLNGIVSYRGFATEPKEDLEETFIFPNPVREDYDGFLAIRGLVERTDVRITDISGNLVFQTKSEGGQAVWDLRTLDGKRAATGVYLVFLSDPKGDKTKVSKFMIIN